MSKQIHITPGKDGGWQAQITGANKPFIIADTKKEVKEKAIAVAKNQKLELVEHGKNGQIQNKNSYGRDPFPPKDTK